MENSEDKFGRIEFMGKPDLIFMWGSYLAILVFGFVFYALALGLDLVDPIHAGQVERSFFAMGIYKSGSFYISTGIGEVSGRIGMFTVLAYGLHFIAGLCFERRTWFVIAWIAMVLLMTLRNLWSVYGG